MKKTVILAMFIIYLGSLVVVNFFGLRIKNFEGTVYANKIECQLTLRREGGGEIEEIEDAADKTMWYVFPFQNGLYDATEESAETNPNMVVFAPHVYPENANNTRVKFIYDEASMAGKCVFFEKSMSLCFLQPGAVTITVEVQDGSNVKETFIVYARKQTTSTPET